MNGMAYRFSFALEARGDEPPELPQQHRRGQEQPAVGGDLDPQGQAVQRAGDVERRSGGGEIWQ